MDAMKKFLSRGCAGIAAIAVLGGCYNYAPIPKATMGDTFTHREKDKSEDLLKGIKQLTLPQAQRIALQNNPTYIAAHHSIRQAEFKLKQAWGRFSPTISAGFGLSNSHTWYRNAWSRGIDGNARRTDLFRTNTGLDAQWQIFSGFERVFAVKAAQGSVEYSKLMDADYCRQMMYYVAQAYNNVLLAKAEQQIAKEDRKFQMTSLKDTNYKFQAGAVPLSDVLNFEIGVNSADVKLITANYTYEISLYALAVLMGYPEGNLPASITFPERPDTFNFHELPPVELYLDTALANRPDLKGYRTQLEIAKYQLYQKYSAYSPTVNAFASFDFNTYAEKGSGYAAEASNGHDYYNTPVFSYGVELDWTIFNGLIRYNTMREYQASVAVADYNVAAQWFTVVGEVRQAYANYIQNVKKTLLNKKIRDLAAKQRDLVADEYHAGNAELTRLNEAQKDLVTYESNLASAYVSVQDAKAQLEHAVGVNTAAYYESMENGRSSAAPGLECAKQGSATVKSAPVSAKVAPAVQTPAKKTAQPAAAKRAARKAAAKPAAKAAQAPVIPASPTTPPAGK